jgi:hypothetical protein
MKFDYDILFDFLSEEDKKSFMVWGTAFIGYSVPLQNPSLLFRQIVAHYRAPFDGKLVIPLDEYERRKKEKQREEKINKIL